MACTVTSDALSSPIRSLKRQAAGVVAAVGVEDASSSGPPAPTRRRGTRRSRRRGPCQPSAFRLRIRSTSAAELATGRSGSTRTSVSKSTSVIVAGPREAVEEPDGGAPGERHVLLHAPADVEQRPEVEFGRRDGGRRVAASLGVARHEEAQRLLLPVLEHLEILLPEVGEEPPFLSATVTPTWTMSTPVPNVGCPPWAASRPRGRRRPEARVAAARPPAWSSAAPVARRDTRPVRVRFSRRGTSV